MRAVNQSKRAGPAHGALARTRGCVYIEQCTCNSAARNLRRASFLLVQGEMSSTTNKPAETPKKGDFEKSLTRLEEVVKRLENTDLSLDDAMKLFEEGMKLSHECQKQLEDAEGRVEILLKKADGKIAAQPFEPQDENS